MQKIEDKIKKHAPESYQELTELDNFILKHYCKVDFWEDIDN